MDKKKNINYGEDIKRLEEDDWYFEERNEEIENEDESELEMA